MPDKNKQEMEQDIRLECLKEANLSNAGGQPHSTEHVIARAKAYADFAIFGLTSPMHEERLHSTSDKAPEPSQCQSR